MSTMKCRECGKEVPMMLMRTRGGARGFVRMGAGWGIALASPTDRPDQLEMLCQDHHYEVIETLRRKLITFRKAFPKPLALSPQEFKFMARSVGMTARQLKRKLARSRDAELVTAKREAGKHTWAWTKGEQNARRELFEKFPWLGAALIGAAPFALFGYMASKDAA